MQPQSPQFNLPKPPKPPIKIRSGSSDTTSKPMPNTVPASKLPKGAIQRIGEGGSVKPAGKGLLSDSDFKIKQPAAAKAYEGWKAGKLPFGGAPGIPGFGMGGLGMGDQIK